MSRKLLDQITIPKACPVLWESMEGTDQVRSCADCSRKVYNLSAMSESEAEQFLQEHGTSECIQFFRRSDGKIMTDRCPAILRRVRNRAIDAASLVAGVLISFFATSKASASEEFKTVLNRDQVRSGTTANSRVLTANSFQSSQLIGGMGIFGGNAKRIFDDGKESCGTEGWHNRGFLEQQGKDAYNEYKKARDLRSKNKLVRSYHHYQRAAALAKKLSCGMFVLPTIESEQREVKTEMDKQKQ